MTITKTEMCDLVETVYFEFPRINSKSALRDILDQKTGGELSCTELDILLDMTISRINRPQPGYYHVKHQRKSEFIAKIDEFGDEWISGTVAKGIARAAMHYNTIYEGEPITMRRSLVYFYPIKDIENPDDVKRAQGK